MPFHSGKIAFMPLAVRCDSGFEMPDMSTIEAKILQHPYKPLEGKDRGRYSFVNTGSTIPEEFEKPFENPCPTAHVLCDILYEWKVVDMAIVNARTKEEYEKAKTKAKHMSRPGYGESYEVDRNEIRERIIEEELKHSLTKRKSFPVAFCPEHNLILLGTKASAIIDAVVPMIKRDVFGLDDDTVSKVQVIPAMSTPFLDNKAKLIAFGFVPGQFSKPQDSATWNKEFLTWMFVHALPEDGEETFQIGEKIKVDFCKDSEAKTGTFSTKESNDLVRNFGSQWASNGGLVSEITFWVPYDGLNLGLPGYNVKIDKSGYLSDIQVGKMDPLTRSKLIDTIITGCCEVTKDFVGRSTKLVKLRSDMGSWLAECQAMKEIVVDIYPDAHVISDLREYGIS